MLYVRLTRSSRLQISDGPIGSGVDTMPSKSSPGVQPVAYSVWLYSRSPNAGYPLNRVSLRLYVFTGRVRSSIARARAVVAGVTSLKVPRSSSGPYGPGAHAPATT